MNEKFEGMKAYLKDAAEKTAKSAHAFAEHENTKAAVAWTKATVSHAADEAVELGKRAAKSEMGKDAATGAAIGAAIAVPIPLIGPLFGAVVGAGAGVAMNLKSGGSKKTGTSDHKAALNAPNIDSGRDTVVPQQVPRQTRNCPYCAETIKAEAKLCRFCNRDVQPVNSAVP